MNISSRLIDEAVEQLSSLPGIGKRTALRLVLNLLRRSPEEVNAFSDAFKNMRDNICFCKVCNNVSDEEICVICSDSNRDRRIICVVEDIRDVMAIENTQQYKGVYHVLGGIISPMDGVGPDDLAIGSLVMRIGEGDKEEVIFALSTTMEGDTTNFYLFKKLQDKDVKISTLSRGVAIGDDLEYADEVTLGRSIVNRLPFEKTLSNS